MSVNRVTAALALVASLGIVAEMPSAAPPRPLPIAKWVADLGSEEVATWRAAVENLWKAGGESVAALRKAERGSDPDVVLRARLVLARLEWGIRPDTPAAVVTEIERYRDGDREKKKAAAAALVKLKRAGAVALARLLGRENDAEDRKAVLEALKQHTNTSVRELIVAGDLDAADALLEAAAQPEVPQAMMDLAAFRALTGTAPATARRLEALGAKGDRGAAKRATYLYRAAGDLKSARRAAEKAGDPDLLGHILEESEDYKALVKLAPPAFSKDDAVLAALRWRVGDKEGFKEAFERLPSNMDHWQRARVLFACDQPREAIDVLSKGGPSMSLCRLLGVQGRRREALALKVPADPEQAGWMLLEQAAVAADMGERERARQLIEKAQPVVEKFAATSDSLPGALLRAGNRTGLRAEALEGVCRAIDKGKGSIPYYLLSRLSDPNSSEMGLWWHFLIKHGGSSPPSAALRKLDAWFVRGEAGRDFDGILDAAEAFKDLAEGTKDQWPWAMARACVAVGKPDRAEKILKKASADNDAAVHHQALGDFYLERRRWADAAAAYEKALKREPTAHLPRYLRGVALARSGKAKEGRALAATARLLPLGDEDQRYQLAEDLAKRGLREERTAEQRLLVRTAHFLSVLVNNACFDLAEVEEREGRHHECAAYHRRAFAHHALGGGGMYLDDGAYLRVPAWARQAQANGLIAAGKLDEALAEARILWKYLPEEGDTAIALVRAFDKAGRRKDADRLFAEMYGGLRASCVEAPRSAGCNNRLAWLTARCGRRLDEALRHATAATQARPDTPGFYDTLAEARFQRGDKEGAVAAIRRAIQLARPGHPYFEAQLKRMEKGDRKAEVPPERD